ncbi:thermonuclease family protein [Thalassospira sp. MA62]|nr:thermonuclease family protein [Thalassospira sp. MA62]
MSECYKAWGVYVVILLSGCQTLDDASNTVGGFVSGLFGTEASQSVPTPKTVSQTPIKIVSELKGTVDAADVIDGDTFRLNGQKIHLYGIDAPELTQNCSRHGALVSCGVTSRNALIGFTAGTEVECLSSGTDRYGRILARCSAGNFDLSAGLTLAGMAVAYRQYSTLFVPQENQAKSQQAGMWKGTFQMPWEWRARLGH